MTESQIGDVAGPDMVWFMFKTLTQTGDVGCTDWQAAPPRHLPHLLESVSSPGLKLSSASTRRATEAAVQVELCIDDMASGPIDALTAASLGR